MKYNLGVLAGVLTGVALGAVFVIIILKMTKTDNSIKCKFDERQQSVRGVGFKYGFFTAIFYDVAAAFCISVVEKQYIDHSALILIGIFLSVFVYAVYCIWNEGYFSLNANPKRVVIAFVLIALLNFGVGYRDFLEGILVEDGVLTIRCINILCGILALMLLPVMAAKHICKRKEE